MSTVSGSIVRQLEQDAGLTILKGITSSQFGHTIEENLSIVNAFREFLIVSLSIIYP
jgi:hypothetical protein